MKLRRVLRHLFTTRWGTGRCFSPGVLTAIRSTIREVETQHGGEIRFAVETSLDLPELWRELAPRQRATQVFAHLGVWDTQHNNGVLIYVLLADRVVEIVADRGIASRIDPQEWQSVCREIERHFRAGRFLEGSTAAIQAVGRIIGRHFPAVRPHGNELPDQAVLL